VAAAPPSGDTRFASPESYTPKHLAETILTSKAALEGERKQITVLFADTKGSMELLADRDPEDARKILDPILERMMEAVHRYEGTVNQVMGDGIMALFGAPLAHEDHAVRAGYAALRMQQAVKQYADRVRRSHGIPVQIRVGLNSGEVVVRAIGSDLHMDYSAIGQTTHLAARMEQLADPGAIVITPATLALVEGYIEVKSLGPVPVKGLADPIELFEVTGAGLARTRLQAATGRGLTPFVGREAELEQLRRAQQRAGDGHGQIAAIVGEAGVGKSRLVYELSHSHRRQGWLTLESAAVSYTKATSYLPVIDLLKGYFKIQDRDDLREIREKVTGKLLTLDRALEPTLLALLTLLDVPVDDAAWHALDPAQRRQRTLDAVGRLLLREAQAQPLLLIFEDLHWIDGETQALLDRLVESLATAPLLLLVNYRPDYHHDWGGKSGYTQIDIDPLPAESAEALLVGLLGDDPGLGGLRRLLIDRTEGNPFFLEECVRTLVETGVLVGGRGRYRLARAPETIQVPATAQAILAARIDRLLPEDKRLLQTAAAIGKDVPRVLLEAVANEPEAALRASLARLQAAEFLYETRLFPEIEYTFKHALTHEVTYGSLLHDRRRLLHTAIVEVMEHHYAERLGERAERLANHAVRAEAWEKAVTYLWQAGRNARARSAFVQAANLLEQAVEALTRLPVTAENAVRGIDLICRDLSDPLVILDDYHRLLEHLRAAARLAENIGDRARLADVLARMLTPLRVDGQNDRAVEIGERALALAREVADVRLSALAGMELSSVHFYRGEMRVNEALLMEALLALDGLPAGAGDADRAWLRRRILEKLERVLARTGRYQEAIARGEEAMHMAEDLGHSAPMAWTLGRLGRVHCFRGDVGRAIALCRRSLALARERGVNNAVPYSAASLGAAYTLGGHTSEAIALLEEASTAAESTGTLDAYTVISLGQAYLSAGRPEDASRCARKALDLCQRLSLHDMEADALHLLGDVAAGREPPTFEEAVAHYHQALARADKLGLPPVVAHCHRGLGQLYRRTGQLEQAQEHLSIATAMYREMDMPFWLEKAEAEARAVR
jgi:class 3 adenylate cyclase/tetratricopeptide (TPR) repeat protein